MYHKVEELENKVSIYEQSLKELGVMQDFKIILFNLLSKLVNVSMENIDNEIEKGFANIGEFWKFDRITLAQVSDDEKEVKITHSYVSAGIPQLVVNSIDSIVPWLNNRIRLGDTVCMDHLPDDLPENATVDREHFLMHGVKSVCGIPFKIGGTVRGGLFFASIHKGHFWNDDLVRELQYFGEILASAIEHKISATQIDELMRFERLLYEISATYINTPASEIDNVIRTHLGLLGKFLKADRCMLYLASADKNIFEFTPTLGWYPEEDKEFYLNVTKWAIESNVLVNNVYKDFQYSYNKWLKGEHIVVK